jgi:iron complex outermembrane recepter protein
MNLLFCSARPLLRTITLSSVLFLAPAVAMAQSSPPPRDTVRSQGLAKVTVRDTRTTSMRNRVTTAGSRLGVTVRETPASVEAIEQTELQQRGARTFLDAVNSTAGFTAGSPPYSPGIFSVRGFTTNSVKLLRDGVSLGAASLSGRPLDSFGYERVEVIRGPASVLFGEGALGAAINLVNRQPSFRYSGADVLLGTGSLGQLRGGIGVGGPLSQRAHVAYRVDATGSQQGAQQVGTRVDLWRTAGSLLWQPSEQFSVVAEADLTADAQRDSYWGTPLRNGKIDPTLRRVNYNNLPDNEFTARTDMGRVKLDWKPTARVHVRNDAYAYKANRVFRNVESYELVTGGVERTSWGDIDHDHRIVGNRVELQGTGTLLGLASRSVVGVDVNRTTFNSARNGFPGAETVPEQSPPSTSFTSVAIPRTLAREVESNNAAAFAEQQLTLASWLKVSGGLRAERISTNWTYRDANNTQSAQKWTPVTARLGAVVEPSSSLALYGQWATATEPVGTLLLFRQSNTTFELTSGRQFEIGAKHSLPNARGEWTLAGYNLRRTNLLSRDPVNPNISQQIGAQSTLGAEVTFVFRVMPTLVVEGNGAALRARFDTFSEVVGGQAVSRVGNRPPNVPRTVGNVGVRYGWRGVPLELGAWARGSGSVFTDNNNATSLPGYAVVDLSASYDWRGTRFTGRVRNVANRLYASWAAEPQQVMLGDPRTFELQVVAFGLGAR